MRVEQVQVDIDDLLKGMYVCALDRPWLSTPFPFQGFVIKGKTDIDALRKYCNYVYVDVLRGVPPDPDAGLQRAWKKRSEAPASLDEDEDRTPHLRVKKRNGASSSAGGQSGGKSNGAASVAPNGYHITPLQRKASLQRMPRTDVKAVAIHIKRDVYKPPKQLQKELKKAVVIHRELSQSVAQMIDDVRVGRAMEAAAVRRSTNKMIDSIVRHPDALIWLGRLREQDTYSYAHSVRSAIISVAVGRHVGLHEVQLQKLALGSLLCEVGKARLPRPLLEKKAPLDEGEVEKLQGHVELGVELLGRSLTMDDDVVEVVKTHHERFDGTGYPGGLAGDQIPLLGRIAGMVDAYDAMTSLKPYTDRVFSTSDAIDYFYTQRDQQFQSQLVEEFIQAIGLYPTGTLVELTSGQIGLVLSQNAAHRLQPELLLVLDKNKRPVEPPKKIDLREYAERTGTPVSIKRALLAGEHGLNANEILNSHLTNKWDWRRLAGLRH